MYLLDFEDALAVVGILANWSFYLDVVAYFLIFEMLGHHPALREAFSGSVDFNEQIEVALLVYSGNGRVFPCNWLAIDFLSMCQNKGTT